MSCQQQSVNVTNLSPGEGSHLGCGPLSSLLCRATGGDGRLEAHPAEEAGRGMAGVTEGVEGVGGIRGVGGVRGVR